MKKLLLLPCVALAIFILLPDQAFSRGGGGGGGGRGRGNGNNGDNEAQPTPRPSPSPSATPAQPIQGTISNVTPFAISIKTNPQATAQTFKVATNTTITLNGVPVTIAALKPGMLATVTPAAAAVFDGLYATSIVATLPVATPAATPALATNPPAQPPRQTAPQPPAAQQPPGATTQAGGQSAPFGQAAAPY